MSNLLKFNIAPTVESTNAPPIPKAQAWGREYAGSPSYGPLLDLSQGVPRSAPHDDVLKALSEASKDPLSAKYGPILGETALREAYAEEIRVQYQLPSPSPSSSSSTAGTPGSAPGSISNQDGSSQTTVEQESKRASTVNYDDVSITTGCNMAFLVLIMALCPPGSSVMVPLPSYFNQMMVFSLQGVKPIFIPCDTANGFKPDIQAAKEYLATQEKEKKPRMIVLVSPNNPTGSVYTHDELREWYNLAKSHEIALVLDETYRDFVEDDKGERGVPHTLFEEVDWRETLISLGSFSKGYRIPGHRLGSIIASPALLKHATTICDCMQICAPRPPQIALAPLLPTLRSDLTSSSQALSHRRNLFVDIVNKVKGWKVVSIGGYFAYVSFPRDYVHGSSNVGLKRKRLGSEDIASIMARRFGVVTLPGSFFMPDLNDGDVWERDVLRGGEGLREDIWLRFAVANVGDDVILKLGPRLEEMNKLMGIGE
ncbi:hypothetical protein I302_101716 [Kwoniella bestiolae CBS 10118]|uniref:Arylformamidase n=1 Tax=Kwoniella bestiolae CBS 10118 TaxID=1296100 RepID=A0A1B9GD07_9TREE|nr:arylformamidase [Kwoniella bestiolae CBS 10118]OCF28902.1 arylformamidase [Kwoniella bestiolae CBS 10118]